MSSKSAADAEKYAKHRDRVAGDFRSRSASGRDIGSLPPVADPARRRRAEGSFRVFCETYFPNRFVLAWSADHLAAIGRIEQCILSGGLYGYAMPRGSGKTTLAECGALFATLNGHRRFVMLIGATDSHACNLLDSIKAEVEANELLAEDYPEVCFPVAALEGITNRANGQTLGGERTRISWTADEVVFPTVKGFPSSGAVIRVAGITGAIRGAKHTGADGKPIRPDLCILDDPQTDESSRSPLQNNTREGVVSKAVLGLAGPKKKIAAVMPCTIITPGDLADRFLDRERHPEWQGERSAMVKKWPKNQALWDQYGELRRDGLRAGDQGKNATEFYRMNRAAMDEGGEASWAERFNDDELSAMQNAWNLRIDRGDRAFMAEYQNDPLPDIATTTEELSCEALVRKVNHAPRGVVPPHCTRLTAFIDVGGGILYWTVCGWGEDFGGAVVDYGTFPRQNRSYFAASDARPSLTDLYPTHDETARVYAGLRGATEAVLNRTFPRQGGGELSVELCPIDAGWLPDVVHQFVRQSPYGSRLIPSKGYAVGPAGKPIAEWAKRDGERLGDNWRITPITGSGRGRLCVFDPHHWKTFVAQRLLTPDGGVGCLQLFGDGRGDHQLYADHLTAEYRTPTVGRGRTVDVWAARPERRDSHWFDTLVGCAVAASVSGVKWSAAGAAGEQVKAAPKRKRVSIEELYAKQQGSP